MKRALLPLILSSSLVSCLPVRDAHLYSPLLSERITEQSMEAVYKTNIEYVPYDALETIALSPLPLPIPSDMRWFAVDTMVKNRMFLENILHAKFIGQGYTPQETHNFTFKQALDFCLDITKDTFEFELVDEEKSDFAQKYGLQLPLESYIEKGKGDCDKYARTYIEAFRLIQKHNPSLVNILVSNDKVGGYAINHYWVSFVILHKEKLQVVHIDPTLYDTTGNPRVERGVHIPATDEELINRIYKRIDPQQRTEIWSMLQPSNNKQEND